MPLQATIAINDRTITSIHIARMEDFKGENRVHEYSVVESMLPPYAINYAKGVKFTHAYQDGAEVCVEKALAALRESKQ